MNLTIDDLLLIIGRLHVTNEALQSQVIKLTEQVKELTPEEEQKKDSNDN